MHNSLYATRAVHELSQILIRDIYRVYYGRSECFVDKSKLLKVGLSALGLVLTIGSTLVNDKVRDNKLDETVAEKVKEALANQAKES